MPLGAESLRSWQRRLAAVLGGGEAGDDPLFAQGPLSPDRSLGLYAANLRATRVEALRRVYPTIARLLGDEPFAAWAARWSAAHPSRSADLSDDGAGFPELLAAAAELADWPWLADVARLEWAWHRIHFDPGPPADMELPRRIRPSFLLQSRWPIVEIHRRHGPEGDGGSLTVEPGPMRSWMVYRSADGELRIDQLEARQADFLAAAEDDATLITWLEARIEAGDDPAGLSAAVADELRAGRLVAATPPQSTSTGDQSSSR